ncbi:alkaline phosphatase D family protein [Angustibacter peucedani]
MTTTTDVPYVVVGPLLRYVDDTTATIWVETDRPCEVEVLGHREPTWEVHGHHYALVVVEGLEPASRTVYTVQLDGAQAWPEPGAKEPPSVIRTMSDDTRVRLAFGSCRRAAPFDKGSLRKVGADALVALAERMMGGGHDQWPDALLLAGDQVYADDPSPAMKHRLQQLHALGARRAEGEDEDVREEIIDFEEYTWLYQESWRTPAVRWLLSTLPTCMILDDHDLRDDWNSSWSWRQEISQKPWWRQRVVGAFSSYWVYQHLGNLSPRELAQDEVYAAVRAATSTEAREQVLADFAWRADTDPSSARWSYHRDFGRTRLVVLDSRCSRDLDPDHRAMVDDVEWQWFRDVTDAEVDHLLIGTSLPFLLLHGVHHLEGWDEACAQGAWGPLGGRMGEKLRLALDLEHWAAFRTSFDAMVERVGEIGRRERPPASVMWLSGDVHCSYVATAQVEGVDPARTSVVQLTMSPFRNPLEPWIRLANSWFEKKPVHRTLGWLARRAGVRDPGITWTVPDGPWFDNGVMTVDVRGRRAQVEVEHAKVVGGAQVLDRTRTRELTPR